MTRVLKLLARDGLIHRVQIDNQEHFRWAPDANVSPENWIDRQVFGEQIKQSPEQDRPRELLLRDGAAKLSDSQLLAILIRVGVVGESAVQAGRILSNRFPLERIAALPESSLQELRNISKTIRKDSYAQIMAGIELGRRIAKYRDEPETSVERITGSDDAIRYCIAHSNGLRSMVARRNSTS